MPRDEEPARAHIEQQLVLTFKLPGVTWQGRTSSSSSAQLQQRLDEEWTLKVTPENLAETVVCLRAVVAELERYEQMLKVFP